MRTKCNEVLFGRGHAAAICSEPFGTEHDHSDRTIAERLATGADTALPDGHYSVDVEFWHGEVMTMIVVA